MAAQTPEPSGIRGLFSLLIEQGSELARLYVAAARQEVEEGLNQLRTAAILIGIVVSLVVLAGVVVVVFVVSVLSAATGLPLWAMSLIVFLVLVAVAVLFGWLAYRRIRGAKLMPEETIAAAREDLEWAQHWTKRG
ncbi:MAG: phage holin family protein [Candidatus Limnocylindria bacterium]